MWGVGLEVYRSGIRVIGRRMRGVSSGVGGGLDVDFIAALGGGGQLVEARHDVGCEARLRPCG